jgi:CDP-diacylglycerol--glycerol-3-phosphate 3-phosphatidyltransferase
MNLPIFLTLFRIFLVPFLVVVLLTKFDGRELLGGAIFLIAIATDWLDGYLARKRNQVTTVGKLLDPVADKLLISAAFISLVEVYPTVVPAWMVVVIVGRELAVSGFRSIISAEGQVISASVLGKYKMISQSVTIVFLILAKLFISRELFRLIGQSLLWVVILLAIASAMDYFFKFWYLMSPKIRRNI